MWKKKLLKNKSQYGLIGIIICVSTFMFALCFCYTAEFSTFAGTVLTEENSSDIYVLGVGTDSVKEQLTNDTVKANIKDTYEYKGKAISRPIVFEEEDVTMMYQIAMSIENINETPDFSLINPEDDSVTPSRGEIWISNLLAEPCGIEIGDTITLDYDQPITLKVSEIYSASFLITPNFAFSPVILSSEDFASIESERDTVLSAVNFNNDDAESISDFKNAYQGAMFVATRTELAENFIVVASPVGSFASIATLIIFVAALFMIRYIVKSTILKELKTIGVYKGLGYSYKKIRSTYTKGFMLVGFIAALIGALASLPLIRMLGISTSQYAQGFELTPVSFSMSIASVLLYLLLLKLSLNSALKVVKKKTAVDVITMGNVQKTKKANSRSIIKNAYSPLQTAINDIFKSKKMVLLTVSIFVLSTFLILLFTMIGNSSYIMNENKNLWFGIPKCDVYALGNIDDEFTDWLDTNNQVEKSVYGTLMYSVPLNEELSGVSFDVFSDRLTSSTGITISGGEPKNDSEIAVTSSVLEMLNKDVGEDVNLTINGVEKKYRITGTYTTMLNSNGIMISVEAMKNCVPEYIPYSAFIALINEKQYNEFVDSIEENFSGVTGDREWFAIDNATSSIRTMLLSIAGILIVVIIAFAMINISVIFLLENKNKRRRYGILKALGFTNEYIIKQNMWKNMICIIISIVIALALHLTVSKKFLAMQVIDAFSDSYWFISAVLLLIMILAFSITYMVNLSIKKIMPKELMEE